MVYVLWAMLLMSAARTDASMLRNLLRCTISLSSPAQHPRIDETH